MDISIRELKSGLSRYLREVQKGVVIRVTSRGKPVARLVPIQPPTSSVEIKDIPGVDPGSGGKPAGADCPVRVLKGQKTLSDIVMEDRR